jgi:hypothetical protein
MDGSKVRFKRIACTGCTLSPVRQAAQDGGEEEADQWGQTPDQGHVFLGHACSEKN